MKYNLKNRPKFAANPADNKIWHMLCDENDAKEWFDGFQKELRQIIEYFRKHNENSILTDFLEGEILGDE